LSQQHRRPEPPPRLQPISLPSCPSRYDSPANLRILSGRGQSAYGIPHGRITSATSPISFILITVGPALFLSNFLALTGDLGALRAVQVWSHGATLEGSNNMQGGATFAFTLPARENDRSQRRKSRLCSTCHRLFSRHGRYWSKVQLTKLHPYRTF